MAPHANQGGVTDVNVDENYTAPAGVPPEHAIAQGIPDAGQGGQQEEQQQEDNTDEQRDDERSEQSGSDPADTGTDTTDGQPDEADADGKRDTSARKRAAGGSTKRSTTR